MTDALTGALLSLAEPGRAGALFLGLVLGFVAGIVPGIGGRIGLLLSLPLAVLFDPLDGAVFLIALHSVVHTSGSVTPIAYGLPTSASEAATALDGFQLQRQGKGAEALGASLSASALGGVLGAAVFIVSVPIVRPLVTGIGAPEFLLLSLLGLALISALSDRQPSAGLAVAALGVLASTVGVDALTAQPRYTFGRLELWDGLETIAVIGGLFVIPEMLALAGRADAAPLATSAELRRMVHGMAEAFRYKIIMLRSTIIGIIVGIMPGAGSSVAVWIAYADAAQRGVDDVPLGSGSIAGVVAPEAANNSKEGGALIPTVFFGIPGSSSMAILLGGFAMLGIDAGPSFLTKDLEAAMTFGWTVVLANLLTIPLFLLVVPFLVRLTGLRPKAIAPFALLAIVTAALGSPDNPWNLAQFAAGGALGVLLYLAGLPRAPFLLGFVIGPMVETSLAKTLQVFGPSAILRPGVLLLGGGLIFVLLRLRRPQKDRSSLPKRSRRAALVSFLGMAALGVAAIITAAAGFSDTSWIAPVMAATALVGASSFAVWRVSLEQPTEAPSISLRMAAAFTAFVAAIPATGLLPASLGFLLLVRRSFSKSRAGLLAALVLSGMLQILMVEGLMGRPLPFGVFGGGLFR